MSWKAVWVLVALIVLVVGYLAVQASRSEYLEFDRQREAWHRRCDAYVGRPVSSEDRAAAESCKRELEELTAYARNKGWR
jgi:hypothetical protein